MSAQLPVSLCCRLYNSLISSSTLAYGCEAWKMTLPVQRMINSICSKQLSLITKRTIHQEAKHPTIDALGQIKRRRHEYLGHILRLDPSRLLHRFIAEIPPLHKQGSLTSEVPFRTLDEMKAAAEDRDGWRKLQKRNERTDVGESRASLGTARSR